jgi:hypothetical protein
MTVTVVPLESGLEPAVTAFLADSRQAMISHSLRYRDLLLRVAGGRATYAVALRDGCVAGLLPIMERDGPFGMVLNSLPFYGSNGGVVAADLDAEAALWRHWSQRISAPGVAAATAIISPLGAKPDIPTSHIDTRAGYITPLDPSPGGEAVLWAAIDGSARRNIRKAGREGVRVGIENDAFDFLEATHRANMAAMDAIPRPPSFFSAVRAVMRPGIDYNL